MEETGGEPIKPVAGFTAGFAAAEVVAEPARQLLSNESHVAVPTIVLVSRGGCNHVYETALDLGLLADK